MRLFLPAIPTLLLLTLAGCPVNIDTPRYPTSQPANKDLVGFYRPTAEATALVKKTGGYADREMSITLSADGTFHLDNIPDWWRTEFGKPSGGFDSGGGTWKTVKQQGWWALQLEFSDTKDFPPSSSVGQIEVNLIGQKPPYDIALTIGDPDQGQEMRFSRASPTTAAAAR